MDKRIFGIAGGIAMAATPAVAENWRASSSNGEAAAFIDTDSVRRDREKVTFWREVRWTQPRIVEGGVRFDRVATHYEADCRAMTLQSLRMRASFGAEVVLDHTERAEIEHTAPGSTAHTDLRAACFDEWPR